MDSQVTIAIIGALATLITAIVTGVQSYRAGVAKNKSVEAETSEKLYTIVNSQLGALDKSLQACSKERIALETDVKKWRVGFGILRSVMRNHKISHKVNFQFVESNTLSKLQDTRDEISNSVG